MMCMYVHFLEIKYQSINQIDGSGDGKLVIAIKSDGDGKW